MIPTDWLIQAADRIAPHIKRTPLTIDTERELYIKWENHQVTGSFKARGAFNKLLLLDDWERAAGIVAASAGNHGLGLALAGQKIGARVEVFVSEHAVATKVDAMRSLEAVIHVVKGGYPEAESAGNDYAAREGKTWVSPYNDGQVIAGQGTIGLELISDLPEQTAVWLVPVSGGGLLAGIGASIWEQAPRPRLIGVQAEAAPFMHNLFYHGNQDGIRDLPSLADGLTGEIEHGSVTIPMVKQMVDDITLVNEDEIARGMAFAWEVYGEMVEASGAVGLAAVITGKVKTRPAMVVVSGGNVQPENHAEIIRRFTGGKWQ